MKGFSMQKIIGLVASMWFATLVAIPTAQADAQMADSLIGTWVGTSHGYDGNKVTAGFEKIVINEATGRSALGTWQYRVKAEEPWSAPILATFTVFPNDASGFVVAGADRNGVYTGELSAEGELTLAYLHINGRPMSLQFQLARQ